MKYFIYFYAIAIDINIKHKYKSIKLLPLNNFMTTDRKWKTTQWCKLSFPDFRNFSRQYRMDLMSEIGVDFWIQLRSEIKKNLLSYYFARFTVYLIKIGVSLKLESGVECFSPEWSNHESVRFARRIDGWYNEDHVNASWYINQGQWSTTKRSPPSARRVRRSAVEFTIERDKGKEWKDKGAAQYCRERSLSRLSTVSWNYLSQRHDMCFRTVCSVLLSPFYFHSLSLFLNPILPPACSRYFLFCYSTTFMCARYIYVCTRSINITVQRYADAEKCRVIWDVVDLATFNLWIPWFFNSLLNSLF